MSVCTLDYLKSGHGNFLYPASFLREKVCPHKRTKCVNIVSYQNEMYITIFQFTVYKISLHNTLLKRKNSGTLPFNIQEKSFLYYIKKWCFKYKGF